MADEKSREDKFIKAAEEIVNLSKSTTLVNLRFLNHAVHQLPVKKIRDMKNADQDFQSLLYGTDGSNLYYQPEFLIRCYKKEANLPARMYLHSLLHCIFQHFYTPYEINKQLWDLACDISVEAVIAELDLPCFQVEREAAQIDEIEKLKEVLPNLTAERIYKYWNEWSSFEESDRKENPGGKGPAFSAYIEKLNNLFALDDHLLWYPKEKSLQDEEAGSEERDTEVAEQQDEKDRCEAPEGSNASLENPEEEDEADSDKEKQKSPSSDEELELRRGREKDRLDTSRSDWKKISLEMQIELETFLKDKGEKAGVMIQNLRAVNRETYDYKKFLEKFATLGEAMQMNDEEFDYVFYTYGLNLYGNVPLIEPLEYRDVKRVKDFVVVIDTSGSTKGDLVQAFVQKTFNILKQQEHFHQKMNLHLIQCDAKVQEDVKITSEEELDRYLKEMKILGQGGTDFRPAFTYVEELIEQGEFEHLQGLIYFTDGYGTFPKKEPDYKVAVVFVEEDYENPDVPVWAIKLVVKPEEICDEY